MPTCLFIISLAELKAFLDFSFPCASSVILLANKILASFISSPSSFSSLDISLRSISVNNLRNFITSSSTVFLQNCQKSKTGKYSSDNQIAP